MRALREVTRAGEPGGADSRPWRRGVTRVPPHTDVVLAAASEWQRDPLGGELVDGEIWGRGALDMKGEVAASAVALATLSREGWRGRAT